MEYIFNLDDLEKFTVDFIIRETGWQVGGIGDTEITFFKNALLNNFYDKHSEWVSENTREFDNLNYYICGFTEDLLNAYYTGLNNPLFSPSLKLDLSYLIIFYQDIKSELDYINVDMLEIYEYTKEMLNYYMREARNSIHKLDFHIAQNLEKNKFFCRELVEHFYDDFMNTKGDEYLKLVSSIMSVYYYLDKNQDEIREYCLSDEGQEEVLRCEAFNIQSPEKELEEILDRFKERSRIEDFGIFVIGSNGKLEIIDHKAFIERWCPIEFLEQLELEMKTNQEEVER